MNTQCDQVAGIFIAEDHVIVAVADHKEDEDGIQFDAMYEIGRSDATGSFEQDLKNAFDHMAEIPRLTGDLLAIGLAMPGPISGSGTISGKRGSLDAFAVHRKDGKSKVVDVQDGYRRAWSGSKLRKKARPKILVLPDAAAYAIGEYWFQRGQVASRAPADRRSEAVRSFRASTVLAHVTVDEGVGGAIALRDDLAPTRFHAEMGHIQVAPHYTDPMEPDCPDHGYSGCVESRVSIPALKRRWGDGIIDRLSLADTDDEILQLVAYYLAQLCASLVLIAAPSHISFSGRVALNPKLIDKIGYYLQSMLTSPKSGELYPGYDDQYLPNFVGRRLRRDSGVYGCIVTAWRSVYSNVKAYKTKA